MDTDRNGLERGELPPNKSVKGEAEEGNDDDEEEEEGEEATSSSPPS